MRSAFAAADAKPVDRSTLASVDWEQARDVAIYLARTAGNDAVECIRPQLEGRALLRQVFIPAIDVIGDDHEIAALCGHQLRQLVEHRMAVAVVDGGPAMAHGSCCDPSDQQFEIVGRGQRVRVFLRDGLALFGDPQVAAQRAMRQRFEETMRRTRTTADGAATAMEKAHLDADLGGRTDQLRL